LHDIGFVGGHTENARGPTHPRSPSDRHATQLDQTHHSAGLLGGNTEGSGAVSVWRSTPTSDGFTPTARMDATFAPCSTGQLASDTRRTT
jgi:hypothetical protein